MDDFVLLETTSCEASDTEKQLRHLKSSLNEEILTFDKKSKKKKKTAVTRSEFNLRVAVGFVITSLLAVSFGSSVANLYVENVKLNDRLMAAEHDNFYLELVLDDYESRVIPELRDEIFAVESLVDSCDQIMGSPGVYYAPPHVEEAEIVTTPSIETPIMPCLLPGVDPPVPKPIIGNSENIMKPTMTNRRKHRKPLPDPNPTDHVFELNNCWVKAKVELGVCSASIESALSDVGHEAAAFVQSTAVELSKATNQIVAAVKEDAKTGTLRQVADTSRAVSLIVNKQATAAVIGGALVAAKAFVLVNSTLSTGWEEVIKSFG